MTAGPFPVSIKAVLFTTTGDVILLQNDRQEWELPGGRLEPGESPERCLVREIDEELGLAAEVGAILDSYLFEVVPNKHVFIVTYRCKCAGSAEPRVSPEHVAWAAFKVDALPVALPEGYRISIAKALDG